ncbi:MAG: hypothetical protein NC328_08135 [Muribaculum sp.]|nr:hypothetical protein [Muribaculum sp.]
MATYKSEIVNLKYPAEKVYGKLSHPENLKTLLDNVPADKIEADKLQALQQIEATEDTISFPAGPVGNLTLRMTERVAPTLIKMEGEGTPVPMSLKMEIFPDGDVCQAEVSFDIDIPMMLKPMVNGPLKKMTEQFAEMLRMIPFD